MYEGIIETLIRLFAIITDYREPDAIEKSRLLVESYLRENFNIEMVDKYMLLYHNNIKYYHIERRDFLYDAQGKGEKIINHRLLEKICDDSVVQFNLEARFMIIVQLLNFIHRPEGVRKHDLKIVNKVAKGFRIDNIEYKQLVNFYLHSIDEVEDKSCLFVVNGNETYPDPEIKHLYRENQQVELELIRIGSINAFFFKYHGPRNLYLNGHRLTQHRLYVFPQGGILRTSRIIPIYYSSILSRFIQEKGKPRIIMNVENAEYRFSRKVYGLHPISFQERSGDLVGILGGSGVGKTTLLNVLCGKLKPQRGKITINGYDLYDPKNEEFLKGVIGYVTQDEFLLEELTVYQNLEYNARFCFGNLDEEQILQRVEKSLVEFDLVEARDLVVGSPMKKILSGGQRKRLNIALELMREPSILLVDEPTSGLSSSDSEKVIYLLKKQCLKGNLVIVNIHQPASDIYKLFDRIIVLDKGGRTAFFGNPIEAISYFKTEANYINPEESECRACGNVKTEQPLKIIEERMVDPFGKSIRKRKITPEEWYERYRKRVEPRVVDFMDNNPVDDDKIPDILFKKPGWFRQLRLFFQRDLESKRTNRQYISLALFETPILALILGFFSKYSPGEQYVFAQNDNIPSFLFMSMVIALFVGMSISAEEIFKDRRILKREQFLNLSRGAYFSSKILLLFLLSAFQMICFVAVSYLILDFRGLTFSTWAILFSTACFANILGLNLSSGLNSIVSIYVAIPLILVPQLLFSGLIVDFNKMNASMNRYSHTPVVADIMASRWAYEALAVDRFKNNRFQEELFSLEQQKSEADFMTFYWLPELQKQIDTYRRYDREGKEAEARVLIPLIENSLRTLYVGFETGNDSLKTILSSLATTPFNPDNYAGYKSFLDYTKDIFYKEFEQANRQLDHKIRSLEQDVGGNEELIRLKNSYTNKKLESLVRGLNSFSRIRIIGNHILQGDEPIYRNPVSRNGRAHFYSPYKYLGKMKIGTVLFNILILWFFTILLMVSLYFDVLRKALGYIERWRLIQQTILRDKIFYNPMAFIKGKKR